VKGLRLLGRILRVLAGSGLVALSLPQWLGVLRAWWIWGNSFAFLGRVGAIRFPGRVALVDDQGELTFSQLWSQAQQLAGVLRSRHALEAGSQVALLCPSQRGFALGLLAATGLGADVLPLGCDLPEVVLQTLVERQRVSLILYHGELGARLRVSLPNLPAEALEVSSDGLGEQALKSPAGLHRATGARVKGWPWPRRGGQLVVLTSGSTGISKGIRRRPGLGELLPVLSGLLDSLPFRMHQPFVLAIPLFHGYGLATLAMSLALGSPLYLAADYAIAPLLARFTHPQSPSREGEIRVSAEQPPVLVSVPTLLFRWLANLEQAPPLAAIVTGSAPLHPDLCQALLRHLGPILYNLYGSTEAGLVALATPSVLERAPGSVGRPLAGNQVRILDCSGQALGPDQIGKIWVRGPLVLQPGADGWRDTGDLGRFDRAGYLHVCGRADSMLVSGGENVYPHELEDLLARHPDVEEAVIVVVDDPEFGQRMRAAVVLKPLHQVEEAELRDWLKSRLERWKMPRQLRILQAIPRNSLGKVDRPALNALLDAP